MSGQVAQTLVRVSTLSLLHPSPLSVSIKGEVRHRRSAVVVDREAPEVIIREVEEGIRTIITQEVTTAHLTVTTAQTNQFKRSTHLLPRLVLVVHIITSITQSRGENPAVVQAPLTAAAAAVTIEITTTVADHRARTMVVRMSDRLLLLLGSVVVGLEVQGWERAIWPTS